MIEMALRRLTSRAAGISADAGVAPFSANA